MIPGSLHLFRAAIRYPVRPAAALGLLEVRGNALVFAVFWAVVISAWAGFRAALAAELGSRMGLIRFGSSLFGFLLFGAAAAAAGRLLGGKASNVRVVAALVGCALPFLLIDSAWIAAHLALADAPAAFSSVARVLTPLERASQAWALVLLVVGLARVQDFGWGRAIANVLLVAVVALLLIVTYIGLRGTAP